jgi:Restriction alleviation protein Lar
MVEIKPCPFCGTKGEVILHGKGYYVVCPHETCQTGSKFRDEAIQSWNTRVEQPSLKLEYTQVKLNRCVDFIMKIYNDNVHYYGQLAEKVLDKIGALK